MRRFLLWLCFLFIAIVGCSCRTSKNTDTSVNAEQQEMLNRIHSSIDSLRGNMSIFQSKAMERMSNLRVENKTVYYSKPDSTGRQYTTAVSETKSESNEQESQKTDTELQASVAVLSVKVDSIASQLNTILNKKEKVIELTWWDRNKDKLYLSVALVIIGWLVYKSRRK